MLFSPKRPDGRAEWRVLYDHIIASMKPDDTITYKELGKLLSTRDRPHIHRVMGQAKRKLWATASRSMMVVPNVGYRMLRAEEHEAQAKGYQIRGRRSLGTAVSVIRATDLSELTAQQRNWTLQVQAGLVMMAQAVDALAKKQAQHDDLIKELQDRMTSVEERQKS